MNRMTKLICSFQLVGLPFWLLSFQVRSQTLAPNSLESDNDLKTFVTKHSGVTQEDKVSTIQGFSTLLVQEKSPVEFELQKDAVSVSGKPFKVGEEALHSTFEEQLESSDDCRLTITVPVNRLCCSNDKILSQISSMQKNLAAVQAQMNYQRRKLEASETVIRQIRYAMMRRDGHFPNSGPRESHFSSTLLSLVSATTSPTNRPRSEAAKTLQEMSEEMQVMLTNLEIQIDEADSTRKKLQIRNLNLTRQIFKKETIIHNLTTEKEILIEKVAELEKDNAILSSHNRKLTEQTIMLENENIALNKTIAARFSQNQLLQNEQLAMQNQIQKLKLNNSNYRENLRNVTKEVLKMKHVMKSIKLRNLSQSRCLKHEGFLSSDEKEEIIRNYTHCGILVNIAEPQTVRQSRKPILHRAGVWMRDPLAPKENNKVWAINQSGVRVRKLYQYSNLSTFTNHLPEMLYSLPVSIESNGAVMYNGSLYFQRRNSRRIARYRLFDRNVVADRSIKHAGFHGMFAYRWGGFTDIDFAVDETGLWVIYSSPRSHGNIVVSKINPRTLAVMKTVGTPIQKRKMANAFIICQVLYTVSGFKTNIASINYSFDLKARTLKKLNIPFPNNYQFNTMVDYNPSDRYIYSWDNGRQVRYQAVLDHSMGRIRSNLLKSTNRTSG